MYTIIYKNGIKMKVADVALEKIIQSMLRVGINYVSIIHEDKGKVVYVTKNQIRK